MATMPGRETQLRRTVDSLLPQVDQLRIYLNNPDMVQRIPASAVPEHPAIHYAWQKGDLGDAGKFAWSAGDEEIARARSEARMIFTVDDDIIYPPDYVEKLAWHCVEHNAPVGVHGIRIREPIRTYYKSRTVFHCAAALERPTRVHMLGTGTLAYLTSQLAVSLHAFPIRNMADVWFGVLARRAGVALWAVERPAGWLQTQEVPWSIHQRSKNDCSIQTAVVKQLSPWPALP